MRVEQAHAEQRGESDGAAVAAAEAVAQHHG
jgi:hypothetical protein